MKKLTKVIFIIALLAMVVLPLSAAKAMNVSWQWLLSDPDVTAYRYQLNGEVEDGWTVVDGKTDTYSATDLDPYKDYTLYLQCSYDGVNWSESATSTAYALLQHSVVETVSEPVVEEPKADETTFYVYGYGVSNKWLDGHFESTLDTKGLVSAEDVSAFLLSEKDKYPELSKGVDVTLISDGFALDYPRGLIDEATLVSTYRADLTEYVESLLAPKSEEKETPKVEESTISLYGYTLTNTYSGTTLTSELDNKDAVKKSDILDFIAYENNKYAFLKDNVTVDSVSDGKMVLTVPEGLDLALYTESYKNEIIEYCEYLTSFEYGLQTTSFTLFGYTVDSEWKDGYFKSTLREKGVVSSADVLAFARYEVDKYPLLLDIAKIEVIEDGFILTLPEDFTIGGYLPTYEKEIKEYVLSLFPGLEAETVAPVASVETKEEVATSTPAVEEKASEPVEETKVEEVASTAVEPSEPSASSPEAAKKVSESRVNFIFTLGADFGLGDVRDINTTSPTIFPRLAMAVEGQNLVKFGAFGLGLRSDLSIVFIPTTKTFKGVDFDYLTKFENWGMDATIDLKLMSYINGEKVRFYLGAGLGYSLASNTFTTAHSSSEQVWGFNSAFALTGVAGFSLDLGRNVSLLGETNARLFFKYPVEVGELSLSTTLGLAFKF